MAKGFKHGGGSPDMLNFEIIGGTQAPATVRENTVWINTDREIAGWCFSAEKPEAAEAGAVWIATGQASEVSFNALKKNGITVYPISAWQYVSGEWVNKEARSFLNGAWADWIPVGAIYHMGNPMEDITGGWTSYRYSVASGYTGSTASVTNRSDHLEAVLTLSGDYRSSFVSTVNAIDLTDCSSAEFEFDGVSSGAGSLVVLQVYSEAGDPVREGSVILSAGGAFTASGSVNVASLTGRYRVGFMMWAQAAGVSVTAKLKRAVLKK